MHPALAIYQRAWNERRIDLLNACFTDDASYVFRPAALKPPCLGLAEIRRYWEDHVLAEQESAHFQVLRSTASEKVVWCEWQAEVVMPALRPGNDVFPMWGTLICDLAADSKISRLVEYYFWDPVQRLRLEAARAK